MVERQAGEIIGADPALRVPADVIVAYSQGVRLIALADIGLVTGIGERVEAECVMLGEFLRTAGMEDAVAQIDAEAQAEVSGKEGWEAWRNEWIDP